VCVACLECVCVCVCVDDDGGGREGGKGKIIHLCASSGVLCGSARDQFGVVVLE